MSKMSIRRAACLAMVFAAMLGAAPHANAKAVPFKGVAAAVITAAVPDVDGIHLTVSATGEATHLGRFTRIENLVLFEGAVEGTIVFTAANGDQLFADVVGGFVSATRAEGTYTITGGTGRFADATGSAVFVAETADGLHFDIGFEGTISF